MLFLRKTEGLALMYEIKHRTNGPADWRSYSWKIDGFLSMKSLCISV